MKWPRPAGDPDPTSGTPQREEDPETPSWLSSEDLASSPRPWERDDLVGLVESVASGERELAVPVPPPAPRDHDTPMYRQLRSERPAAAPADDAVAPDEVRSETPAVPAPAEVRSEVADPEPRWESPESETQTSVAPDAVDPSPAPQREAAEPAPAEPTAGPEVSSPALQSTPDQPSQTPDTQASHVTTAPDHVQTSEDAVSDSEPALPGQDNPQTPNGRQEPSSSPDLDPEGAGSQPFHVERRPATPDPDAESVPDAVEEEALEELRSEIDAPTPAVEDVLAEAPVEAPVVERERSVEPGSVEALDLPDVPAAGATAANEALEGLDSETRHATVICVANQKGGVGKTTTTVSLGAALAQEGAQVLVVDLDPQGNATTGLGLRAQEGAPSTYRVIVEQMDVEDASEPTAVKGLHVLPSSLDLAGAEIELVPAFSREMRLKNALDAVRDLYDVILIDCPPSLGLLTINAFVAADQVLVPIQCEYYALEGLGQLMRTVKLVSDSLNKELVLGGVVLTMFDGRTNLSQQVVDEVRAYFGETAYQTIVPRTVRLSEAPSYGQPIGVFDPSSRGARSYQRLAREVARRLGITLESQDVSPLDRLLGTVSSGGPTGTGISPDAGEDEGALPSDLDREDVDGLTETSTVPSATASGPDHGERPWSQTAGGWSTGTEADR